MLVGPCRTIGVQRKAFCVADMLLRFVEGKLKPLTLTLFILAAAAPLAQEAAWAQVRPPSRSPSKRGNSCAACVLFARCTLLLRQTVQECLQGDGLPNAHPDYPVNRPLRALRRVDTSNVAFATIFDL